MFQAPAIYLINQTESYIDYITCLEDITQSEAAPVFYFDNFSSKVSMTLNKKSSANMKSSRRFFDDD